MSYITQRGAAAVYTDEGQSQIRGSSLFYIENADSSCARPHHRRACPVYGGENAPYVWVGCPEGQGSWDMFDRMLEQANVVGTPGSGFGAMGEGYFRLSAFNSRENVEEAIQRITSNLSV